jgi:hypothetical protein
VLSLILNIMVKVDIDTKTFRIELEEQTQEFFSEVNLELFAAAKEARNDAVQDAPIFNPPVNRINQRRAGDLKGSIALNPSTAGSSEYEIVTPLEYAPFMEFGTGTGFVPLDDPNINLLARQFIRNPNSGVNIAPRPYLVENTKKAFAKFLERIEKIKK